jgi:flagellar biosynthesis/type III secretory pathway chaperone
MIEDARRRLEDLLDSEIEAARLLASTLAAERDALTGDSPDAVRQRSAEKVRLLETLEGLERERRTLSAEAGLGASLDASHVAAPLANRWRALMELIAGCRAANEVNGYIVHVRQHQIRQLMDIVRGASPAIYGPPIYGPQGKTFAKALRALAQA